MQREEILKKSRQENRDRDLFEKSVAVSAGNVAAIAAALLATIFFCIQIFVGEGKNYALYAIVFSIPACSGFVKYIRLKNTKSLLAGIACAIAALFFSATHIYQLISTSTIL